MEGMEGQVPILYQDPRVLVCLKPPGVASVDQPGGVPDLLRGQLGPAGACLRTVHRLDQPVGGVMVLARSRMAARLLGAQMEERRFGKEYLAVLSGIPEQGEGRLEDLLGYDRGTRRAYVTRQPGREARPAALCYRTLAVCGGYSLVSVALETGRTHQIRIQFAHRGMPLAGDVKYGGPALEMAGIGLWSHTLSFDHPQTGTRMTFSALPTGEPWNWFEGMIPGSNTTGA